MRLRLVVTVLLAALACLAGNAVADGDPASDILYTNDVYLPYDAPSASTAAALKQAVEAAYAHHFRVKVAVIASVADLGSVSLLWNKPTEYARFLGAEIKTYYVGPLLVVMPAGFGVYDGGRSVAAERRVLTSLSVGGSTAESLTRAAARAVVQLNRVGALRSRDITAPLVTPLTSTVAPGHRVPIKLAISDDSGWSRAVATVISRSGHVIATLKTPMSRVNPVRPVSVFWRVPPNLPTTGVRLCAFAVDPTGNQSKKDCVPVAISS